MLFNLCAADMGPDLPHSLIRPHVCQRSLQTVKCPSDHWFFCLNVWRGQWARGKGPAVCPALSFPSWVSLKEVTYPLWILVFPSVRWQWLPYLPHGLVVRPKLIWERPWQQWSRSHRHGSCKTGKGSGSGGDHGELESRHPTEGGLGGRTGHSVLYIQDF